MTPIPEDCRDCGVCCFARVEEYVRVTGDDYERMGDRAQELVVFRGNRAFLTMADGERCSALARDDATGRFRCSAYDVRPEICRNLERGSPECAGEIAEKADRPLQGWR